MQPPCITTCDSIVCDLGCSALPQPYSQLLISEYSYVLTTLRLTQVWSDHMPLAIVVHGGT